MDEIRRLRDRIDEIDQELVLLIKSRYENARFLGRIKRARGIPLRDHEREKIILQRIKRLSGHLHLHSGMMNQVFRPIFDLTVAGERNLGPIHRSTLKGLSILIVGGTGRMGRFLAGFASLEGARVKIAGHSNIKTKKIAGKIEVDAGTSQDAARSDIVIISVPIKETERVAMDTVPLMREESLLLDVSSVKTFSDKIAARVPHSIEYVSIHPLFAPDIDQMFGQAIVTIPYRSGPKWRRLDHSLRESGAKIYPMTANQHDRRMAYTQGLHHFALMALGIGLADQGGEPTTRSLRDTQARITSLMQNWETVRAIQTMNPFVPDIRQHFLKVSERLSRMRPREVAWSHGRLKSYVRKWSRKQ